MISCCRYCVPPKRYPGCHSKCEEYLAEKEQHEEAKRKAGEERSIDRAMKSYEVDRHDRARKHKRR